jgi:putative ATP-dependent endonuclease of OLD family
LEAIRVGFSGFYDVEEDDFEGKTYFLSPKTDEGAPDKFTTRDKRRCGFLFLRTLRTGSRALSLEHGSLLDIILKLQEKRLQMWEDILIQLKTVEVAEKTELGIQDTLKQIQDKLMSIVPIEWANNPHIKVSDLTREHLRRTLTVFMDTGIFKSDKTVYSAPFQHQGTGTINTLVLSLLAMIADLKQNVIFAMEEPEIAIPPHTQKRIVESVRYSSAQALFTSHSPYILEEFEPDKMIILRRDNEIMNGIQCSLPPNIKLKSYKEELRRRFCEALLARRVLITEGRTEYDAWITSAKCLSQFDSNNYKSLSNLGIAVISAETDSQVADLGEFFIKLGKQVFAVFDKQSEENRKKIEDTGITVFEAPEKGFENVILHHTTDVALRRFALSLVNDDEWSKHLISKKPTGNSVPGTLKKSLMEYFKWGKGSGTAAKFISQCESIDEIPEFIRNTLTSIIKSVFDKDNVQ